MKHFSIKLRKILLCNYFYYFLLFLTFIYIFFYLNNYEVKSSFNEEDTLFNLTINDIKIDGDKVSFTFKENIIGNYYLKSISEKNKFNYELNDKVIVIGEISLPKNNTIPNVFNYKNYLNNKGVKYIISINEIKLKKKNKNIFYSLKNYVINRINKISNNDYLYAFILGKSAYLDDEIYNNYKINGITHLFALSGLHVSLFSSFLLFICKKFKINEFVSIILISLFLLFFCFVASFTPSILRATLFFIFSSLNKYFYFYIKPINILYLVFIILEFLNPLCIFNTGFILSFIITFFILLFNENFKIKGSIKSMFIISLLSFFSSLPVIINMSYEINIIGFINNLFFIPFVSYIVFPLSLLTFIFPFLSGFLNLTTDIMEYISMISSIIFNITFYFKKIGYIKIIIYYCCLIFMLKRKVLFIILFIFILISIFFDFSNNKNTNIYFLDVGQGDCTLIVSEKGKSILIDTGGSIKYNKEDWKKRKREFNLYISSVIPFFKSIGLKKIDYLFLTHGDNDHLGYSQDLIDNFKVDNIIINKGKVNYAESKLEYEFIEEQYNIDNVYITSLNNIDYGNENDNSIVLYVVIDEYKFLFMGDAGIEVEEDLMKKYNLKDIDVLKVGHHGSKTSSSRLFIEYITPKYSIISVGENNKFGHPNDSVLETLNKSKVYRTDKHGTIVFNINNNKLLIETCIP